jgi:hypothetical protein
MRFAMDSLIFSLDLSSRASYVESFVKVIDGARPKSVGAIDSDGLTCLRT